MEIGIVLIPVVMSGRMNIQHRADTDHLEDPEEALDQEAEVER